MSGQQIKSSEALWCVHVQGPDDVHCVASRADGDTLAAKLNAAFESNNAFAGEPSCKAVVIPWPYSAKTHADELARATGVQS